MRTVILSFILAFLALPLQARQHVHEHEAALQRPDPQHPEGENLKTPPDWVVRLDRPREGVVVGSDEETADIYFVNMTPGWHITTGPAAIFYHPASTAEGAYRAEALIHLFDPQGRNEAFGLIFGGRNLDADDLRYDYFLIRNSGDFLIKRRTGGQTSTIQDWTPHPAVATYGPDTEGSVPNTLAVEVGEDHVAFYVNGEKVSSQPRARVDTDGIVGLRINHALNVHVEDFKVVR